MNSVLLTGATGFLGKYVVQELLEHDFRVIAIGRNSVKGNALPKEGCTFYSVDFTQKQELENIFAKEKIDFVIHAGALSSAWGSWDTFYKTNVCATKQIGELCIKYGIKRLVYISSPSVYSGKTHRYDIKETDFDEHNHLNFYIRTKIISEKELKLLENQGLHVVILRPRGLIGKGDPSLMPRLMRANDRIGIPLFNQGENMVDITCVENVAYACYLAMVSDNVDGEVFNITNGEPAKFRELLSNFCNAADKQPHFRSLPFPLVYGLACILEWIYKTFHINPEPILTKYTVCTLAFSQTLNIEKAQEKLHYKPKKTLKEGIDAYGKWWKEESIHKTL